MRVDNCQTVSLLWKHARQHLRRWGWGCFLLLLTNGTTMLLPQLFRFAINDLQEGAPLASLRSLGFVMVVVALGGAVVRTLSRIHILYAARDVELDLRCTFYNHLTQLEPAFYQKYPIGDLMSRSTNDLTQVRLMLGPGVLNLVNTAIAYASAVPLMLLISVKLTCVSLAIYPPSLFLMRWLTQRLYVRNRAQQESLGRLSNFVQENLAGSHVVRAFAIEAEQTRRFQALNDSYYDSNIGLAWVRSQTFRLVMSLSSISILLAVTLGARDVLAGKLEVGDVVALVEYLALLSWPTFALGWILSLWQRGAASMARLQDILQVSPTIVSGTAAPAILEPSLTLRGLTVQLGGHVSLRDVAVTLPAGHVLGIVGPIGGGKSTLVRALVRLVDVPAAQLFVGGVDAVTLTLEALRRMFGYVPQNPGLFSKSVAENVAFGRPHATLDAIHDALRVAAFLQELERFTDGLATQVGERGVTLSGGQKQRVALARAVLLDPPILLLDDALSAVDSETEVAILRALKELRHDRTTVIVAHRISAVSHADEIIVLSDGAVVERGTHASLLADNGVYADMARRQELARAVEIA